MDAAVPDELIGVIMLSGLTPDYDPLIMALENSGTKVTADDVASRLVQEESRKKQNEGEESSDAALWSSRNSSTFKGQNGATKKKKVKCFGCGKLGHFKNIFFRYFILMATLLLSVRFFSNFAHNAEQKILRPMA